MQNTWVTQSGHKVEVKDGGYVKLSGLSQGNFIIPLNETITKNNTVYVAMVGCLALTSAQVSIIKNAKPLTKSTKNGICHRCHSYCYGDCEA